MTCKEPVRPDIAQTNKGRQDVTLSGIEEEERTETRTETGAKRRREETRTLTRRMRTYSEVRIREEEGEETRTPRAGRIPTAPTKKELEEHLPLHVPYKELCPICVSSEGIHDQARRTAEAEKDRLGITISMDYCFLSSSEDLEHDPKVLIAGSKRQNTEASSYPSRRIKRNPAWP